MTIHETLAERGKRYGDFAGHADITQALKFVMGQRPGWGKLTPDQREALEMIVHKIGRILNGDPNWADSWVDIAGYAQLVADRLTKAADDRSDPIYKARIITTPMGAMSVSRETLTPDGYPWKTSGGEQ